jgi:hypothetical protein
VPKLKPHPVPPQIKATAQRLENLACALNETLELPADAWPDGSVEELLAFALARIHVELIDLESAVV